MINYKFVNCSILWWLNCPTPKITNNNKHVNKKKGVEKEKSLGWVSKCFFLKNNIINFKYLINVFFV